MRPKYQTFYSVEQVPARFDLVEIKHDGMWCVCYVDAKGGAKLYNRRGLLHCERKIKGWKPGMGKAIIVGELMVGTPRSCSSNTHNTFIVFDCLYAYHSDLSSRPLKSRKVCLGRIVSDVVPPLGGAWMRQSITFPRADARRLWDWPVMAGNHEGLVFKCSIDYFGDSWARVKKTVTQDYILMGVVPRKQGRLTLVGGLLKDGELSECVRVYTNVPPGLEAEPGQVFEASGNQLFQSGALRHPRFERMRPNKKPNDCILKGNGNEIY